ncbi:hypothetical protein TWF506_000920 [Arthrobotrys conoides]|uniref:Uncharacterized protein n=1 Tax=Arthrobotrys conoides TaxID=74498 RepID=A0AAN8P8Y1_9PEZI
MFIVFFSGLSFHINTAILVHMFGIDMTWGATAKEKVDSNFWIEVPRILKTFKWMYLTMGSIAVFMTYCVCEAPTDWRIIEFTAIVPLSTMVGGHLILPLQIRIYAGDYSMCIRNGATVLQSHTGTPSPSYGSSASPGLLRTALFVLETLRWLHEREAGVSAVFCLT